MQLSLPITDDGLPRCTTANTHTHCVRSAKDFSSPAICQIRQPNFLAKNHDFGLKKTVDDLDPKAADKFGLKTPASNTSDDYIYNNHHYTTQQSRPWGVDFIDVVKAINQRRWLLFRQDLVLGIQERLSYSGKFSNVKFSNNH